MKSAGVKRWVPAISFVFFVIVLLLLSRGVNRISMDDAEQAEVQDNLNVALVNEDRGMFQEGTNENIQLGMKYIKKIEKDDAHNWYVVGRGIAEKGLKEGKYQLMVIIPSDFSQKMLDLNNPSPEKLTINYKVNGNGNSNIEMKANRLGGKIINDLDKQLVDIYVASILSNLYTAQQNVQIAHESTRSVIHDYSDLLYTPATSFSNVFPSLVSQSQTNFDAAQDFQSVLANYTLRFEDVASGYQTGGESLQQLFDLRTQGTLTYSEFIAQMIELGVEMNSEETDQIILALQSNYVFFQNQFQGTSEEDLNVFFTQFKEHFTQSLEDFRTAVSSDVESTIQEQLIQEAVAQIYEVYTAADLPDDTAMLQTPQDITLGMLLQRNVSGDNMYEELQTSLAEVKQRLIDKLNELPWLNPADIPADAELAADDVKAQLAAIQKLLQTSNVQMPFGNSELAAEYEQARYLYQQLGGASPSLDLKELTITDLESQRGTVFELMFEGVTIEAVAGGTWSPDSRTGQIRDKQLTIFYMEKSSDVKQLAVSMTNGQQSQIIKEVDFSSDNRAASFGNVYRHYGEVIGRIQEKYDQTADYIEEKLNPDQPAYINVSDMLDMPITDYLKEVIAVSKFGETYNRTLVEFAEAQADFDAIIAEQTQLTQRFNDVGGKTSDLNEAVNQQIQALEKWRADYDVISSSEAAVDAWNSQTTEEVQQAISMLEALKASTDGLKDASEMNAEEGRSLSALFEDFDESVTAAQKTSKKLSADATTILHRFDEELAKNGDFVDSFLTVLNAAHKDGVTNEELLQFISNPISGHLEQTIAATEVQKPFNWVVLIYIISLFGSYLVSTGNLPQSSQNIFKKRSSWLKHNALKTMVSILGMTLAGMAVGIISDTAVGLEHLTHVFWVISVVLIINCFGLVNLFLFDRLSRVGFGLSLAVFTAYFLMSEATGNAVIVSGITNVIKSLNPLTFTENYLAHLLAGDREQGIQFVLLTVSVLLAAAVNVFVPAVPKKKVEFIHDN